ncbi:4'-phosphopantetheinyl transferase family protein [Cohnella mopanensis]|uniref:4'-phosphopantetheinyl transferase family protein n=1 Tax=Cohnella mopanensis TaxID=2911966 RepID=UPI001EF9880C|nr:4'-phosphopantetheinyl transferase superfamily protein [Cohnella mopanensis]
MDIFVLRIDHLRHAEIIEWLSEYVSKTRLNKAKRYKVADDFNRSVISELLVNYILLTQYQLPGQSLEWATHSSGKPYLRSWPDLYFNVSHAQDFVACVFDRDEVGVDIEYMREFRYSDIANRFFTRYENTFIANHSDDTKLNAFYKVWTHKESYLKAIGSGLFTALDSFEIRNLEDVTTHVQTADRTWNVRSISFEPDYMLSVCRSAPMDELIVNTITLEQIAKRYTHHIE